MAIIHWKHPFNGDFAVAANWNPAAVPGTSDLAAIDASGATYTVTSAATSGGQQPHNRRHRYAVDREWQHLHDRQWHWSGRQRRNHCHRR